MLSWALLATLYFPFVRLLAFFKDRDLDWGGNCGGCGQWSSRRCRKIIGRRGQEIESLRRKLGAMTGKDIYLDIREVKRPEIDAQLVSENIGLQLERRIAYRRAMKRVMASAMRLGALGIKVTVAGRLGGAEIARREWYREGRVPLATLRADIDYGFAEARTTFGVIGIKVWIFKGEVLEKRGRQAS